MGYDTLSYYPLGYVLYKQQEFPLESAMLDQFGKKYLDQYLEKLMPEVDSYFHILQKVSQIWIELPATDHMRRIKQLGSILVKDMMPNHSKCQSNIERILEEPDCQMAQTPEQSKPLSIGTDNVRDAILQLGFVALYSNKLFEHINESLKNAKNDISEKDIEQLKMLREQLSTYTDMMDQIVVCYSHCTRECPEVKDVHQLKLESEITLNEIDPTGMRKLLPQRIKVTQEDILCAVVGVNSQTAEKLMNVCEEFRNHQPDKYWLDCYLNIQYLDDNFDLNENKVEALMEAGFTGSRAKIVTDWISKNELSKQQTLKYWIKSYLNYMFNYNVFLCYECPHYPFHGETIDEWKEVDAFYEDSDDDNILYVTHRVPIINTTVENTLTLCKDGMQFPPHEAQPNLWYHGTDHRSAAVILNNGIRLEYGSTDQDFSDSCGFYLSPYYEYALEWAQGKGMPAAVIMFDIDPNSLGFQEMNLSKSEQDWVKIVKFNRNKGGKCPRPRRDLRREFEQCDFIKGPMSYSEIKHKDDEWEPKVLGRGDQICIVSRKMAEAFTKNVCAAVFINRPPT